MTRQLEAINVSDVPVLRRIAEEVARTGEPHVSRRDGVDLAVVRPVAPKRRRFVSEANREAFRAAAGSWKDFDLEKFLAANAESRRLSR